MLIFTIRRLLSAIPLLFLLSALTFFSIRLAPGGPFDAEKAWPPEIQANLNREWELDLPVHVQFGHWLKSVAQGDLRQSFQYTSRSVNEIIGETLPISLYLGLAALAFSIAIGIPLGAVAAARQNSWVDHVCMFLAVSGISLPSYLVASVLVLVFALWLGWLPPALWDEPGSLILPMITLAWRPMAMIARLTRASMLDAARSDYVRTALSKGLPERAVLYKHVLKNSLIPVVTLVGPIAASLVTGSFLVEMVFQLPGMGKHFVQAVINRDYSLVMGVTLIYGVILVVCNLLVDIAFAWIDPRIRLTGARS